MILAAAAAAEIAARAVVHPTPADQRLGVYVLAAVFGLLVSGVISCVKEMRREVAGRP